MCRKYAALTAALIVKYKVKRRQINSVRRLTDIDNATVGTSAKKCSKISNLGIDNR